MLQRLNQLTSDTDATYNVYCMSVMYVDCVCVCVRVCVLVA